MCISNQGADIDWIERYQIVKIRVCFQGLLSKILKSLSQYCEIIDPEIADGSVACDQDKNYNKMGLKC